jgi:hypothetical protein
MLLKSFAILIFLIASLSYAAEECAKPVLDSELNSLMLLNYGDATCSAMKNFPDGKRPSRSYSVSETSYNLETAIKKLAATCDDILFKGRTRVKCFKVLCSYNCTEMSCTEKEVDLTPYYKNKPKS